MCDLCASVVSSDGFDDPVACSKSINWLIQQIMEANDTYETVMTKKLEVSERWAEAKQTIIALNKQRALMENKIKTEERNFEAMNKLIDYKMKVCTANATMFIRAGSFNEQIQFVEKSLKESREKLNGWRAKLSGVVEDYKAKRSRLGCILRRQKETHIRMRELESDLARMNERIKVLNGKKSFRLVKFEVSVMEMSNIGNEIKEAESRQMLSEQHIRSLNIYQEAIENEYREQRIRTQEVLHQYESIRSKKK